MRRKDGLMQIPWRDIQLIVLGLATLATVPPTVGMCEQTLTSLAGLAYCMHAILIHSHYFWVGCLDSKPRTPYVICEAKAEFLQQVLHKLIGRTLPNNLVLCDKWWKSECMRQFMDSSNVVRPNIIFSLALLFHDDVYFVCP